MDSSDVQPLHIPVGILVTSAGRFNTGREEQFSNAKFSIIFNEEGSVTEASQVQPLKALRSN